MAYTLAVALGYGLARLGWADNLVARPVATGLAVMLGGWLAGWLAGVAGPINGTAVAILFIVGWAVQNGIVEAQLVQEYGPKVLPRMNMRGILLGDLLLLTAAATGGWLAELWRQWRTRAEPTE